MASRLRVKRHTTVVTTTNKSKVKKLVDSIADNQIVIDIAVAYNKAAMKELNDTMEELGLREFKGSKGEAEYITPTTRASSTIQVRAFKDAVSEDDFIECITVGKTKAKKVMSERELEAISTVNKVAKKTTVLVVKPI